MKQQKPKTKPVKKIDQIDLVRQQVRLKGR